MRKVFAALLVACVLTTAFVAVVDAQSIWQRFNNVWANSLRVSNNGTVGGTFIVGGNTTVGGTLATTGASTAASYAASGAVSLGTLISASPVTTITVVADGTVTPTGFNQPISAAGGVGTSSITVLPNGSLVLLTNVGSNTITFTDTGTLVLGGNAALGANDTLLIKSDGTNWYQVSKADN